MKHFLLLSLLSLSSFCITAMEMVPYSGRDQIKVLSSGRNIFVEDEDAAYRIPSHNQNALLREVLKRNAMSKFVGEDGDGYVRVDKNAEGKYVLAAKVRGNGGTGPITATIVGLAVRVGCYTAWMLGSATAVTTGTVVGGPGGGISAGTGVAFVVAGAGGYAGIIASTEALAMKAQLGTLLLPFPLP